MSYMCYVKESSLLRLRGGIVRNVTPLFFLKFLLVERYGMGNEQTSSIRNYTKEACQKRRKSRGEKLNKKLGFLSVI